VKEAFILD